MHIQPVRISRKPQVAFSLKIPYVLDRPCIYEYLHGLYEI